MLYNVLHIGDKVLTIAGISVKSASEAYRILESHYCGLYVSLKDFAMFGTFSYF